MVPRQGSRIGRGLHGVLRWLCLLALVLPGGVSARQSLADLLAEPGASLIEPAARARIIEGARAIAEQRRAEARAQAITMGLPLRVRRPDGALQEIADFHDGKPLYFTTQNVNAGISTAANLARINHAIDGGGIVIGMWDGGSGRATHQEFGGRLVARDGAASIDHATHVGGTLIAGGVSSSALGMAPAATVDSYDWNSDTSEMAARGATGPGQADRIYLSNHSYNFVSGWNYVNSGSPTRVWEWYGNGTSSTGFEQDFGRYNTYTRDQDALAYNAPYYLIFRSAGNERTNNPATGQSIALSPGSPMVVSYDPALHPPGDGSYRGGFDTIAFVALAKNVVTVGAVNDAVTSGSRDTAKATMTSFSSWGPTDDGRIKPDVVANGASLYSPVNGSDSSYAYFNGTSMATPNACGSTALLVEQYATLFAGGAMRASTLKGLLIHTADDLGNPGPDYKFGWGLVDTLAAADLLADHKAYPDKQRLTEGQLNSSASTGSYPFVSDGSSPIRVTLCWTDPAGSATTTSDLRTPRLVNNLDLKVIDADGGEHFPFVMPFVGDWSQAAMDSPAVTGINNTDNVEQVVIAAPPAAGTYQVVVSHSGTLTNGSQNFSLLISGSSDEPPPPPPLTLSSVSPASGLPGPVTLDLTGTGFEAGTAVKLARSGFTDIPATSVTLISDTALRCDLDLTGAAAGLWDVTATNPDAESDTLTGTFTLIGALWSESFDGSSPPAGWTSQATTGSNSWSITTDLSHSPTKSYFAPAPAAKTTTGLNSPAIPIPSGATDMQLRFWHHFDLESQQDGGRLEFSLDGGSSWFDVTDPNSGAAFASNGYNSTIKGTGKKDGRSEFAGLAAWSGTSNGFIETIVNLTDTAMYAGHSLQIRWRLATNGANASPGWHVDTVSLLGGGNTGNQPPVITVPADSASTETVTDLDLTVFEVVSGAAVELSVAATDDGGEAALSYTWSVSEGPGTPVFFSPNETNAAKLTTANFESTGDFRLAVAVSDAEGLTVSSPVNIRVLQQATGVAVAPDIASLTVGTTQAFTATLLDQFGVPMGDQPASFDWAASGGGTIDPGGLFTASTAGGPFVITATNGSLVGNANVTVNPAPATVTLGDLAQIYDGSPKPVSATTAPTGLPVSISYDGSPDPPTVAGSYAVAATVTDPNYQGDATGTLVISMPDFNDWQNQYFSETEQSAGLAEPTRDPDGDGAPNLLEYALGHDPRVVGKTGLIATEEPDGLGVRRLTLRFTRPAGLPDVDYVVEAADTLDAGAWQAVTDITVIPDDPPDTETVLARDAVDAGTAERRFIRLRVSLSASGD